MKNFLKSAVYLAVVCTVLLMSNCQKNPKDIKPTPPIDETNVNAMYPVTQSSGFTYTYVYDKDNHLQKYTRSDNVVEYNIGTNQVDQTVNQYMTNSDLKVVLSNVGVTSFVYTLVGTPDNKSVNIFNTAPTQVKYTYYNKNVLTGVSNSSPGGLIQFYNNKEGLPVKMISSDGGGFNYNYTYDDHSNLIKAEFVSLTGPRADAVYGRLTFSSFDDKPSPFSAVKGYWPASFPQSYPPDYALAFCKHNPKQIISENFNADKNAFEVYQKDDFSYVYNEKGYPTQITVNTTYITGITTYATAVYNYTYK